MHIHGFIKEVICRAFFFLLNKLFLVNVSKLFINLFVFLCGEKIAAYSCSMELCLNSTSERKLRYIDYFMHRINLLRHYNLTPVVVFDGGNIPCKAATEQERHRHDNPNLFFFFKEMLLRPN